MNFITKDSGARKEYWNGFVRDDDGTKIRYDLIPLDMLKRLAELYTRWAEKYGDNNRQNAQWEDINSFKRSARRHFVQRQNWERDEDHGIAVVWNIIAYEHLLHNVLNNEGNDRKSKEESGETTNKEGAK